MFFAACEVPRSSEDEMEEMVECILGLNEVRRIYLPQRSCTICTNYFLFSDERR